MNTSYTPPKKVLERYADVLVNFALGKGKGIKKGDVVLVQSPDSAKPLFFEILRAVRAAGGHAVTKYFSDNEPGMNFDREFFLNSSDEQIKFFPEKLMRGQVAQIDHSIYVDAENNKHSLKGIDPKRMMMRGQAWKPVNDWLKEKENKGQFTWTVGLYGTSAMAKEAGLSEKEYWNQIIKACFLDKQNPVSEWKTVTNQINKFRRKLNNLKIEKVNIKGSDVDLWIKVGKKRIWSGGDGANIPSFEIFTSPDWRGTEGWIKFNQPLYRYGNLIEGIELEFKNGRVVRSKASRNEKVLKAMIATPNADKIGEFSLTDARLSRITKFMGETLYDENVGGRNGNTHIALGMAYHECYDGDPGKVSKKEWEKLGYNDSSVHTDIVSTAPRTITAYLSDGSSKVIYKNGQFTL